jgi:hypothetical protein
MVDCSAFPMGFFFGVSEDGRLIIGKRDPTSKEVVEIYEVSSRDEEEKEVLQVKDSNLRPMR